jgi:hypothetical protein
VNEVTLKGEAIPDGREIGALARELGAAFRRTVDFHKETLGLPLQEAAAQAEAPASPEYEQMLLGGPADQVGWSGLEALTRKDPELMLRRWEQIKREALDELQSGNRAARVLEGFCSEAWQRAQFLALREDLAQGWQPRTGMEWQLIDVMAQAQTAMFSWLEQLSTRASIEVMQENSNIKRQGEWNPPRVSRHQAIEQAAGMADRFNKMFLRTLRALRDLRRYTPTVIVQNAGQVNVGGQQVNVSTNEP